MGLTAVCFRAEAFRTLDLLAIGPTCRLRKIFTMKEALDDASGEDGEGDAQDEPNTTASVPGGEGKEKETKGGQGGAARGGLYDRGFCGTCLLWGASSPAGPLKKMSHICSRSPILNNGPTIRSL